MTVVPCHTCALIARRDRGEAPPWACILRTEYWDVAHSYDTSLEGWIVLVLRRHVTAVAELTIEEARECGDLQRQVSIALTVAVGCERTYVAQFTEALAHPHLHYHVIPRMPDVLEDARGPSVFFRHLGRPEAERVAEARMDAIAAVVRASLLAMRQ